MFAVARHLHHSIFHPRDWTSRRRGPSKNFGYTVTIPTQPLCCGRPLYDYGWLDQAKYKLRQSMGELWPQVQANVPIIGLEPSCASVFRDELVNLFPKDDDARRLSKQVFLLGEFLTKQKDFDTQKLSPLKQKAVVQLHCHQASVLSGTADLALLRNLGLDISVPENGCCGMAGAFGFEEEHVDVSRQCGERTLLPAVRESSSDTLVIADGFSCREQIQQGTGRRPLHLAEILQRACDTR